MEIVIIPTDDEPTVRLDDPDTFNAFRVVLHATGEPASDDQALKSLVAIESADHVLVPPTLLERLAGTRATDTGWQAGLRQMLDYAASRGWIDSEGRVRAHVERV